MTSVGGDANTISRLDTFTFHEGKKIFQEEPEYCFCFSIYFIKLSVPSRSVT